MIIKVKERERQRKADDENIDLLDLSIAHYVKLVWVRWIIIVRG
jgi:hypothetical protein